MKKNGKTRKNGFACPIGQIIEKVLSRAGLGDLVRAGRIFQIWDTVVGQVIAKHAQPQTLRNGTLMVAVDSSVWLSELDRYLKNRIREKLNRAAKRPVVRKIVFRVGEVKKAVD